MFHFEKNSRGSNPVLIVSPPELAGMTLESRLVSYDWENQFDVFQKVTRNGSFRPICTDAKNNLVPVSIHSGFCLFFFLSIVDFPHNTVSKIWTIRSETFYGSIQEHVYILNTRIPLRYARTGK